MSGKYILELLDEPDSRISIGDKWLIRYENFQGKKVFEVLQRKKFQKNTRTLIETEDEELACRILKGE